MEIRNRAWRRFRRQVPITRHEGRVNKKDCPAFQRPLCPGQLSKTKGFPAINKIEMFEFKEKNWKLMTDRSSKILRAQKLGFDYPIKTTLQMLDEQ